MRIPFALQSPAARSAPGRNGTGYRRSWRELLALYRRPMAACLAALSVAAALSALAPAHSPVVDVVVASRDLPAGSVLGSDALELRELASGAVPPDAGTSIAEVSGSQLAVPLAAGSPVPAASLVGPGLLTGTAPGTVAVPIRPADPDTVGLLRPGQLVDVVLSEGNGYEQPVESRVIARSVPVLWVPTGDDSGAWPGSGASRGMVVVAAPQEDSAELAGAASRGRIFLLMVGSP